MYDRIFHFLLQKGKKCFISKIISVSIKGNNYADVLLNNVNEMQFKKDYCDCNKNILDNT